GALGAIGSLGDPTTVVSQGALHPPTHTPPPPPTPTPHPDPPPTPPTPNPPTPRPRPAPPAPASPVPSNADRNDTAPESAPPQTESSSPPKARPTPRWRRKKIVIPAAALLTIATITAAIVTAVLTTDNVLTTDVPTVAPAPTPARGDDPTSASRASVEFADAQSGTCLYWPPDNPDKPSPVQCGFNHMFEVASPVDMDSFGEPCQAAVRDYLGPHYDPNSRFTISVLWAGAADGTTGRKLLCGLQLLGADGKPIPFEGRVADLDQSKVWPVGTCLGIDSSNRSTDIPVDCKTAHALEVTGAVDLAARFPGGLPSDADQRAFITDACTQAADAYLAPAKLATSGRVLDLKTVSQASWSAGSKQVSCNIGRTQGQGWMAVTESARNP
ncbi:MAG: septum formation family protein, partial [Mycobacterium sp.]